MNNNLSYIIDYIYQKYIEYNEDYIDCIYDIEMLSRSNYMLQEGIISRFNNNIFLPKNYEYIPYKINEGIINVLCKYIEITKNYYLDTFIDDNIYSVTICNKSILFYDQNKLLLNNCFEKSFNTNFNKKNISTLDILNHIRKYYDKRNKI